MHLAKTIFSDFVIFIKKRSVKNRLWTKSFVAKTIFISKACCAQICDLDGPWPSPPTRRPAAPVGPTYHSVRQGCKLHMADSSN